MKKTAVGLFDNVFITLDSEKKSNHTPRKPNVVRIGVVQFPSPPQAFFHSSWHLLILDS
jgi:hypothetical protein